MSQESKSFEESLRILKDASDTIQSGELTLDELMNIYKQGVSAARDCLAMLETSEKELKIISSDVNTILNNEDNHDD